MTQKILVTGMSGLIGGAVRRQLEGKYELSALNRSAVAGVRTFRADIADFEAIRPAFTGQDVVIHLAAKAGSNYSWEDIQQANLVGTYNVFEAARQAGVKRVVYASSGATISGWEQEFPYNALVEGRYDEAPESWRMLTYESPTRPNGIYGASKVWGEALARHFTDTTNLSIICLRIGQVNREDRPFQPRHFSIWCSQRDIAQMIEKCVTAPETVRYDIFYVVSNNKWGYRDISHAREVVGYEPQDAAENYRE
jgi:nucleoside-diphosphate-sugar epimerase